MGKNSPIEWTDHTWNPWRGCHKVSPGCKNCYMFREQCRWGHDPNVVVRAKGSTFRSPLNWPGAATVFTCSWSDFFIEEADPWRDEAWEIIRQTPHLTYLILTKRMENIAGRLPPDWGDGWPNVWLLATTEEQEWLDKRLPQLLDVPAALHGLSLEPLLGPIDLSPHVLEWRPVGWGAGEDDWDYDVFPKDPSPSWVIVSGESDYSDPRPMQLDWVRDLIEQCRVASIPVFVKQLGSYWAREAGVKDWRGADPAEWPADLRVREFP